MPKVHFVKKALKDYPLANIKAGASYYWWKFRYGGKRMSTTYPKASQLTQSEFLGTIYDIGDRISKMTSEDPDDLRRQVEEIVGELEYLRDEQEEKRSNMPDALQDAPTGELLQSRYDSLDEMISELEGIDLDYDEPDRDEVRQELIDEDDDPDCDPSYEEIDYRIESKLREWLDEKISEVQDVSYGGE